MKKRFVETLKSERFIRALAVAALPTLFCFIFFVTHSFTPASMFTSEWNDELFYFKQVEAILHHGYPRGYFGFNESHAISLSFAAWSPVLVWPWVLWGLIFGWTESAPFVSNLIIYTIAMFIFGWCTKPSRKQTIWTAIFFLAFYPNLRYILAAMPETIAFSVVIVIYSLSISYINTHKKGTMIAALILGSVAVLMRPYLLLYLLLPAVLFVTERPKGKRFTGALLMLIPVMVSGIFYVLINHFLSAEYFTPLFYTDVITEFLDSGIGGGFRHLASTLYYKGWGFADLIKRAFLVDDSAPGLFFVLYLWIMVVYAVRVIILMCEKKKAKSSDASDSKQRGTYFLVQLHELLAFAAMLFALLTMYKLIEGSKHLLTFMAGALPVLAVTELSSVDEKREKVLKVVDIITKISVLTGLLWIFILHRTSDYDFAVPVRSEAQDERAVYWEDVFKDNIVIDETNAPSYDNTVIWMFADVVDDKQINTDWQMLYRLPKGSGISCCYREYFLDDPDQVKSAYIFVTGGGPVEELLVEEGWECIGNDGSMVMYKRK
ncbi:MAG: hypothetical protein K6G57_02815 [Lachnospiraceae bacterium]|nr:hypothetical protein [Lachnospiraceae bacterium]